MSKSKAPTPTKMALKIGSMEYEDYIFSLLGDDGRLAKLERFVEVPPTPDNLTPKIFQRKIIEMRQVREELEKIRLQLKSARMVPDRKLRYLQEEIKLMTTHLRVNDPDVRSGRNVKEQDAIIAEKLRDQHLEESGYNIALKLLDEALIVLGFRVADVKNAQQQMRELEKIWADERKDAYHFRFTGDENPLPSPDGPDGELDTRKAPFSEELEGEDFFEDDEEEVDGVEGESIEESDAVGSEDEIGSSELVSDGSDFDLKEDPAEMERLLEADSEDEEDVDNFLESEDNPEYSASSLEDDFDALLEDFDFDDD